VDKLNVNVLTELVRVPSKVSEVAVFVALEEAPN
jgi:hypothetical protein